MRGRSSRTAEYLALFRALETVRGGDALFRDRFAAGYLSPRLRAVVHAARVPALGAAVPAFIDWRRPTGPRLTAAVRTRLIDDLVVAAVADGAVQALVLGAGFDSRAFRLRELAATPVFEVDHPATQAVKRARMAGGGDDGRVRLVPVDFDREAVGDCLRRHGFPKARTVVVIEGVTNYLAADTVDGMFRWLSQAVSPGSRVIFSYVDRAVLDDSGEVRGLDRSLAALRSAGEPWTFGLDPREVPGYVSARGMTLASDTSAYDAADAYLRPLRRRNRAARYYRIAQAIVG